MADPKPGTDVAAPTTGTVAVADMSMIDQLKYYVKAGGVGLEDFDDDPTATALAQIDQIGNSATLEDAFANAGAISARDSVGVALSVKRIQLKRSELDDSKTGVYVLLFGSRLDNGDPIVVSTGSVKIMAQMIYAAQTDDGLPIDVEIIEVGKARKGQSAPLGLKLIGPDLL